jgi:hypothetical protein
MTKKEFLGLRGRCHGHFQRLDSRLARARFELRSPTTNVVPGGARTYKNVHRYFNPWIAIHTAERHSVNLTAMGSAERGSACSTETQAPARTRLIADDTLLSRQPRE